MSNRVLWHNNEYMPTRRFPQKQLLFIMPTIEKCYISLRFSIGIVETQSFDQYSKTYSFIVFGFGFEYNINWDGDKYA